MELVQGETLRAKVRRGGPRRLARAWEMIEQMKNTHVPARVVALLRSMLAVDPARRPQTARELLSAIHRCYTKFSTEARARRRRAAFAVAGLALIVAAIAAGTWVYQRAQA